MFSRSFSFLKQKKHINSIKTTWQTLILDFFDLRIEGVAFFHISWSKPCHLPCRSQEKQYEVKGSRTGFLRTLQSVRQSVFLSKFCKPLLCLEKWKEWNASAENSYRKIQSIRSRLHTIFAYLVLPTFVLHMTLVCVIVHGKGVI